jgi:hypothetical protein
MEHPTLSAGVTDDFEIDSDQMAELSAKFPYFLFSKKHVKYHTQVDNPDSQTMLDSAADHWSHTISPRVGTYVRKVQANKRDNMIAFGRKRAEETERIARAQAEHDKQKKDLKEAMLGDMKR